MSAFLDDYDELLAMHRQANTYKPGPDNPTGLAAWHEAMFDRIVPAYEDAIDRGDKRYEAVLLGFMDTHATGADQARQGGPR